MTVMVFEPAWLVRRRSLEVSAASVRWQTFGSFDGCGVHT